MVVSLDLTLIALGLLVEMTPLIGPLFMHFLKCFSLGLGF